MHARACPVVLTFCILGNGCLQVVHSARVGPAVTARPSGCEIRYERVSLPNSAAKYDQVGTICATQMGMADGEQVYDSKRRLLRGQIEVDARKLGGEMVSVIGQCASNNQVGVEIGVFRTTPAPSN